MMLRMAIAPIILRRRRRRKLTLYNILGIYDVMIIVACGMWQVSVFSELSVRRKGEVVG